MGAASARGIAFCTLAEQGCISASRSITPRRMKHRTLLIWFARKRGVLR
jgi:hypothetical protein